MKGKKIALITGASRGIGAEFAKTCAKNNIHPIMLARSEKDLTKLYDEIEKNGGSSTIIQFDLNNLNEIHKIAQIIVEKFNQLNILVCNAAILGNLKPINDQSLKDWLMIFNVNLHSHFMLLKSLHSLLIQNQSLIIGVHDERAAQNLSYWNPYSMTKNALHQMLETYKKENPTKIKVKFFNPKPTQTSLHKQAFPELKVQKTSDLQIEIEKLIL